MPLVSHDIEYSASMRDVLGNPVPTKMWRLGLIFGGGNVPLYQMNTLRIPACNTGEDKGPMYKWFTQARVDNLLIPFLRRGTAGGKHAFDKGAACISLRTLEMFINKIAESQVLFFTIVTLGGKREHVLVEQRYRGIMQKFHRRGIDTVRRDARIYVEGSDGIVYPTTIPQITLIKWCWQTGIIYAAVTLLPSVLKWKRALRRQHACRKRKAREAGITKRLTSVRARMAPLISLPANAAPLFIDREQFEILLHGGTSVVDMTGSYLKNEMTHLQRVFDSSYMSTQDVFKGAKAGARAAAGSVSADTGVDTKDVGVGEAKTGEDDEDAWDSDVGLI